MSTDQEKNDFGMIDIRTSEYKPAFDRDEETLTGKLNYRMRAIITRGLYNFYPLF
jgi:hypothetical protein